MSENDREEWVGVGALLLQMDSAEDEVAEVAFRIPRDFLERVLAEGSARYKPSSSAPWVTVALEGEADLWETAGGDV